MLRNVRIRELALIVFIVALASALAIRERQHAAAVAGFRAALADRDAELAGRDAIMKRMRVISDLRYRAHAEGHANGADETVGRLRREIEAARKRLQREERHGGSPIPTEADPLFLPLEWSPDDPGRDPVGTQPAPGSSAGTIPS